MADGPTAAAGVDERRDHVIYTLYTRAPVISASHWQLLAEQHGPTQLQMPSERH